MKFVKMHGLGNDFVFFGGEEARRVEANDPAALAQKLCRKHFGVCADGLVLILPSASCDARMRIFNPDGSEAEMCGNALRCVGKYLYETGAVQSDCMSVETLGGVKPLRVSLEHGLSLIHICPEVQRRALRQRRAANGGRFRRGSALRRAVIH